MAYDEVNCHGTGQFKDTTGSDWTILFSEGSIVKVTKTHINGSLTVYTMLNGKMTGPATVNDNDFVNSMWDQDEKVGEKFGISESEAYYLEEGKANIANMQDW